MTRATTTALAIALTLPLAACATAIGDVETRFYAYDPADVLTESLTRGITLQVRKPVFIGPATAQGLHATEVAGSATLERGGPAEVYSVLPAGAQERDIYTIPLDNNNNRGLARGLCPGATEAWLITSEIRVARPLTVQAVGRWADGKLRHCAPLSYAFRGEWATPPGALIPESPNYNPPR